MRRSRRRPSRCSTPQPSNSRLGRRSTIVYGWSPGFTLFRRTSSLVANPTTQGVSLRGLGSTGASRTLVLWDGIPLNSPFGGWVYWTRIVPDELARVELTESASTSLFGDRSMGGAISLFSRVAERQVSAGHIGFAYEAGNRGTHDVEASGSYLIRQRWALSAVSRDFITDGWYLVPGSVRGTVDRLAGVAFAAGTLRGGLSRRQGSYLPKRRCFSRGSQQRDVVAEELDRSRNAGSGLVPSGVRRHLLRFGLVHPRELPRDIFVRQRDSHFRTADLNAERAGGEHGRFGLLAAWRIALEPAIGRRFQPRRGLLARDFRFQRSHEQGRHTFAGRRIRARRRHLGAHAAFRRLPRPGCGQRPGVLEPERRRDGRIWDVGVCGLPPTGLFERRRSTSCTATSALAMR